MRDRVRCVGLGGLFVAASHVACGFNSSGSGSGASLSVGDDDGGASDETGGDDDVADDEGPSSADDSGSADGGSTGSMDGCGGAGTCVSTAPQGWTGPFALASASPPDASLVCPQGWTAQAMGGRDLQAPAASCDCTCAPGGGSCTVAVSYYSDSGCASVVDSGASGGGCDAMSSGSGHGYAIVTGTPAGLSCTPTPSNVVPPLAWATGVVLCAPPPTVPCGEGVCLPAPPTGFDGAWCVMAEGEQGCPEGEYSVSSVVYRSTVDSRGCTDCTCAAPSSIACGSLDVFVDAYCLLGFSGSIPADGACHQAPWDGLDNDWGVAYDGAAPSYACGGMGVSPTGEAAPAEPFTMCCTP